MNQHFENQFKRLGKDDVAVVSRRGPVRLGRSRILAILIALAAMVLIALNWQGLLDLRRSVAEWFFGEVPTRYFPTRDAVLRLITALLAIAGLAIATLFSCISLRRKLTGTVSRAVLRLASRCMMPVIVVFVSLAIGEWLCFANPISQADGQTITAHQWSERYWGPLNQRGFRDTKEYRVGDRPILLVLGDSFAAGYGVRQEERFSAHLQEEYPQHDVWTWAECGWSSAIQFAEIRRLADSGEFNHVGIVALQYFLNDIETDDLTKPGSAPTLTRKSYLADRLYWTLRNATDSDGILYRDAALARYENSSAWQTHSEDLRQLCNLLSAKKIPMLVVIFPFLESDVAVSQPAVNKVSRFFFEQHIAAVVDASDIVASIPVQRRIASYMDGHPSAELHRRIAERLEEEIRRIDLQRVERIR